MGLWDKIITTVSDATDWASGAAERATNFVTGGMQDRKKSERITRVANRQREEAEQRLQEAQQRTGEQLSELGHLRVTTYDTTVKEFIELYEMMGAITVAGLKDGQAQLVNPDLADVVELKAVSEHVQNMMVGGGAGALSGASLALGAWGLAGAVGTASTGTAIGTLSGAAATKATLAWLGGGAVSAGGMGVAGGMAVLGGVVLIPTALAAMYLGQNKAKQRLNEARNYRDEVDAWEAQVNTQIAQLEATREGAQLMTEVIGSLDAVVKVQNTRMRAKLTSVAEASKALHQHLAQPLLSDDGTISEAALSRLAQQVAALPAAA